MTTDDGVAALATSGDFASLNWSGNHYIEQAFSQLPDANGKFTRTRFYRDATWMNNNSTFVIEQLDHLGCTVGSPITVNAGRAADRADSDHFFVRRMRALQWTYGCETDTACTTTSQYEAEGLVELRNAMEESPTFKLNDRTKTLRLRWSQKPGQPYTIPVTQMNTLPYDYGLAIEMKLLTPPGPHGYYVSGQDITVQATLRDRTGHRLHDPGVLPIYADGVPELRPGMQPAGIDYYRGFFDSAFVYWRRKHRERTMIANFSGPLQNQQTIRTVVPLTPLLTQDVQDVGSFAVDGVWAQEKVFPDTGNVFGGAFDPTHAGWFAPASDTWKFHVPSSAVPGTYRMVFKMRRTYNGEDTYQTVFKDVQVGSNTKTEFSLQTGNCQNCHVGGGSLSKVLHGNANRGSCFPCHTPLAVEYDAPIHLRMHFLHSRSPRVDANVQRCANCHLTNSSIQFASKSACLSCHKSYPASHVAQFGPIKSIFYGGGEESFGRCTTGSCHTTHPGSGL